MELKRAFIFLLKQSTAVSFVSYFVFPLDESSAAAVDASRIATVCVLYKGS
jgi:hypothetical protein